MGLAGKAAPSAAFLLWGLLQCGAAWSQGAPPAIEIVPGPGSFTFVDTKGDAAKSMTVHTYLPKALPARAARIVFVMHGVSKNARGYRDAWIEPADRHGLLIVAPLFDRKQWGGGMYSHASVLTADGKPRDASLWAYSVVEHLFDAIQAATGNAAPRYYLYGHSEGGQFVHRLVLLLPEARYARAIAANSGWYTMPAFGAKYPYGLGGSPATRASLAQSLARDFMIMLGELDRDPGHPQLRRTPEAMAQGAHRYERGEAFYREGRDRAAESAVAFGWRLRSVPDAAHENRKMSAAAAAALMDR